MREENATHARVQDLGAIIAQYLRRQRASTTEVRSTMRIPARGRALLKSLDVGALRGIWPFCYLAHRTARPEGR
jgi:hypothetical protein